MFRWLVVLGTVVCCFVTLGCGGPAQEFKYELVVIPKGLTHEHWQSVHRGAERAAADLKEKGIPVKIFWQGPHRENDADEQRRIVDQFISRRVSGIVLAPQHSGTMIPPVERAVREKIPCVIIDSGLGREDLYIQYIATDNYNGGKMAAQYLLELLDKANKPAAKIVMMRYQVGSESTEQREKGFEDVIDARIAEQKKAGEPTITWLSRDQYAGATVDSAQRQAGPLINRLADQGIDAIFMPNESSTNGMLNVLKSEGLAKKVILVGFDYSEPLRQALLDGEVHGLIVQDPYRMGYLGVWSLVHHLEGYDVTAQGKTVSTGEYLITKENVDKKSTLELFDPEYQAKRQIDVPKYPKKAD